MNPAEGDAADVSDNEPGQKRRHSRRSDLSFLSVASRDAIRS